MADPRHLRVKVQADRLPDVGGKAQIALRVSAAIAGSDGDLPTEAINEILPWEWMWDPHDKVSWQLWQVAGGVVSAVDAAALSPAVDNPTDFDLPDPGRFRLRLDEEVASIVATAGPDAALCAPKAGGEVVGRTVYALAESLTALPHPLPAALKVFTVLNVDPAPTDTTATFIAAPKFTTPKGGVYSVDPTPPAPAELFEQKMTVTGMPVFADAFVDMYATLSWDQLNPALDPQRLIDLTTMLVKRPDGGAGAGDPPTGLADDDFAPSLARRIAMTVEPFARILSVLDTTLTKAMTDDPGLREILRTGGGASLLDALDAVAWLSLGPRVCASPIAAPPSVAVLDGIARRQPLFQSGVTGLVLSAADEVASGSDVEPARPKRDKFAAVARSRLDALIGVAPNPAPLPASPDAAAIETDAGLIDFLAGHWLGETANTTHGSLPAGQTRNVAAKLLTIPPEQAAFTVPTQVAPLLDIGSIVTALAPSEKRTLAFGLELLVPTADFELDLVFVPPPGQRAPAMIILARAAGAANLTAKIVEDGNERASGDIGPSSTIAISIEVSRDPSTDVSSARLGVGDPTILFFDTNRLCTGPFYLSLSASGTDISRLSVVAKQVPSSSLRDALIRVSTGPGLRGETAIGFIGPYIPGLTAGRLTWDQPEPQSEQQKAAQLPLDQRLTGSATALVKVSYTPGGTVASLYDLALQRGLQGAEIDRPGLSGNDAKLAALLQLILADAAADAVRRIATLGAAISQSGTGKQDLSRRLTIDSPPLVFRFDQLQSISGTEDLWTRLAGLGLLIARTSALKDPVPAWWSLNVAELHAPKAQQPQRAVLDDSNAVIVRGGDRLYQSIVNPVPLQVGEIDGIRAAMVSYNNRSIIAEMRTDVGMDSAAARFPRRIEAYLFPSSQTGYALPALSFGYAFHVVAYLIGQGGSLPMIMRQTPEKPLGLQPVETTAPLRGQFKLQADVGDYVRSALYRRTRPVGAPRLPPDADPGARRLAKGANPGVPEGVSPLAAEIPIRPSPVSISDTIDGRFFVDQDGIGGSLDILPAANGEEAGLRIDIKGVSWDDANPRKLSVRLRGRKAPEPDVVDLAQIDLTLAKKGACRIELFADGSTSSTGVDEPEEYAEDEFDWDLKPIGTSFADIDSWHALQIILIADKGMDLEPPVVTPLSQDQNDKTIIELGKPVIAPEAAHQLRQIQVLNGIKPLPPTPPTWTLSVLRPSLDFETYSRWINPPLFEPKVADGAKAIVKAALDIAHRKATTPTTEKIDRSPEDPAVTQLYAELVRIFPDRKLFPMQPVGQGWSTLQEIVTNGARETRIEVTVDPKTDGFDGAATVRPGYIYELRVYAGIPSQQADLCPFTCDQRFSPAVKATMRRCPVKADMMLAGPLVQTIEVATSELPELDDRSDQLSFELRRPPQQAETEWIRVNGGKIVEFYPSIRYAGLAQLETQRWNWRGRPQNDLWPDIAGRRDVIQFDEQFATAFSDRLDADFGEILERRIERAHAYGGRLRQKDDVKTGDDVPRLFEKSLDWQGGVNFWRYGLNLVSRYQPMRPRDATLTRSSHRKGGGPVAWMHGVVLDRPSGRAIKKPGLALVLPLTERMMPFGGVPPLLALFNDPFYANFNAGDQVDVAIETARHPLPGADVPKYWQERGPDPIRTGEGAKGDLLPLRLDGPIGYTFDLGTESGRFDHAGLLVTPVKQDVQPWSLIKLRFRRQEAPEGVDAQTVVTGGGAALAADALIKDPCAARVLGTVAQWRVENSQALMRVYGPKTVQDTKDLIAQGIFPTEHEGLVIDLPDTRQIRAESTLTIRFLVRDSSGNEIENSDKVIVTLAPSEARTDGIRLSFATNLGSAGTWDLSLPEHASARVRVVVSVRDKPQKGDTFKPVGDVAVKARVTVDAVDTLVDPTQNRWLTVACLPLTSSAKAIVGNPMEVSIASNLNAAAGVTVAPLRLSQFTPSLWCQFAEAMSLFLAKVDGVDEPREVTSDQLKASLHGTKLTLAFATPADASDTTPTGKLISLQPYSTVDPESQLQQRLVGVVTRYVRDAFDRIRERPVAMKVWDPQASSIDLATPDWPTRDRQPVAITAAMLGDSGRIRFLRVLSGKSRAQGGFVAAAPTFPNDFFTFETIDGATEMNPPDAAGMALGISMPISWALQTG